MKNKVKASIRILSFFAFFLTSSVWAVVIRGKVIIDAPVVYRHTTIQLLNGSFLVTRNGSLTIVNSRIEGTVSPESTFLFDVSDGILTLKNNTVEIKALNIPASPLAAPLYAVFNIRSGTASLSNNDFSIDTPYTAALLFGGASTRIDIHQNSIRYFHGGIMLQNAAGDIIQGNTFFRVSCGNIYIKNSHDIEAKDNTIIFSGNNNVGDGFDIIDSDKIRITGNHVLAGSCYSVFCMGSSRILIADNSIVGGITYAIYATDALSAEHPGHAYLTMLENKKGMFHKDNANIIITGNYLSQNRYGLAASHVTGLRVKNNIFIQYFKSNKNRQFWTNNDVLLKNITGLSWSNNLYKEAFSQDSFSDNPEAHRFVVFPAHNGIVIQ